MDVVGLIAGKLPDIVEVVAFGVLALVVVATVVARLTKSTKDDEAVSKFKSVLLKVIAYMPTFGINPNTKNLMAALKDAEEIKKKGA